MDLPGGIASYSTYIINVAFLASYVIVRLGLATFLDLKVIN